MQSTAGPGRHDARDADPTTALETSVRDDETAAAVCPHCGRPFAEAAARDLHVGELHADDCSDAEREAYESAYSAESADLRVFRLQALAALVLLYFGFLFAYSVFG